MGDLLNDAAFETWCDRRFHRGQKHLMRIVKGCFLTNHDATAYEVSIQGQVLEVFEQVGLASSEPSLDQESGRLLALTKRVGHGAELILEPTFGLRLMAPQCTDRVPIRHPAPNGLDGSSTVDPFQS